MSAYREIITRYLTKLKENLTGYRFLRKPCLMLAAVYALGISAILRADFNYRDDLKRVALGYRGWNNFGRYLSTILSTFIHGDSYLTDISPLPQLIAVLLLAVSGCIVWHVVSERTDFSFWDLAALIPLGLSPHFMGCISYKYDAPYMALSILASVVPILFFRYGYMVYSIAVIFGTLIVCTTYQASSGIFPMLVILLCMKKWNEKEDIRKTFRFGACSAVSYLAGMMIFKLFIMPKRETYVSNSLPPLKEILPVTFAHLKKYFSLVKSDFKTEWLIFIFLMMIAFIFVMVRDSKRKKYAAFFLSVLGLLMMCSLSFGMYPVLSKPLFNPRAMYGFGAFITFVGIAVSTAKKTYPAKLVCLALSWCFFVFSFTYGNALKAQEDYTDIRIAAVINDLNDLDIMASDETKIVQLDGSIGYAPAIRHMPEDYKILKRLVPVQFKADWIFGEYQFFHYYRLKKVKWNQPKKSSIDLTTYDLPVLKDTMYHTIRGNDNYVLIELK